LVLGISAVLGLAAALPAAASAGTIAGTVTEAAGAHGPLGGVEVCWHKNPYDVEDVCTTTAGDGSYALSAAPGEYSVHFRDRLNRNVVDQYNGGSSTYPGNRVTLASPTATVTANAQLQPGSTIKGKVTDAGTGQPLAGIPVCAFAELSGGGYERCWTSGSDGTYEINGLTADVSSPGKYEVEFQSGLLNYQPQDYNDKVWPEQPDRVEISAPGQTESNIDAAMKVGVEITGRVTEAGTGSPLSGIEVELLFVGREGNGLSRSNANGEFRFWGQREGDYNVLFSRADGPFGTDIDCYAAQYFNGSSTLAGATVLHGVPGTPITGINAALVRTCPKAGPPPLQVTFTPAPLVHHKRLHCRKGFEKKRVKGKARCVKRHKKHHGHRHRHH
jgi:hypothetical protein